MKNRLTVSPGGTKASAEKNSMTRRFRRGTVKTAVGLLRLLTWTVLWNGCCPSSLASRRRPASGPSANPAAGTRLHRHTIERRKGLHLSMGTSLGSWRESHSFTTSVYSARQVSVPAGRATFTAFTSPATTTSDPSDRKCTPATVFSNSAVHTVEGQDRRCCHQLAPPADLTQRGISRTMANRKRKY